MTSKTDVKAIWIQVRDYPNVVGYCPRLRARIRNGVERSAWSFRVFVSKKILESELETDEVIPKMINGVPIDVVEFSTFFGDEITMSGEFILIDDAYVGESYFLLP